MYLPQGTWEPSPERFALLRARVLTSVDPRTRDEALYEVVLLYRQGYGPAADLLWRAMADTLSARTHRYHELYPIFDRSDIGQELVIALYETALSLPLLSADYLERRLFLRAAGMVSRKLRRQFARQQRFEALPEEDRDELD